MASTQQSQDNAQQTQQILLNSVSIDLNHVSVSQLLGRDYVFLDSSCIDLHGQTSEQQQEMLSHLIKHLNLSEAHTVVISMCESSDKKLAFTRHDLTWYKHTICRIENVLINNPEQHEFMDMIWQCSTPCCEN